MNEGAVIEVLKDQQVEVKEDLRNVKAKQDLQGEQIHQVESRVYAQMLEQSRSFNSRMDSLGGEIGNLRSSTASEISGVKIEIVKVNGDLKTEIEGVKTDLAIQNGAQTVTLQKEFKSLFLKIIMSLGIPIILAIIASIFAIARSTVINSLAVK
jgi:predicted RNase H-like nuclease (RuvC/YqgF family)